MNEFKYTRFSQDYVDPQYLANMETATKYFMSWLLLWPRDCDFSTMLMTMHRFTSAGGYVGHTNSGGPQVAVTSQFRGLTKNAWRPVLKPAWFTGVNIQDGYILPILRAPRLRDTHYLKVLRHGYELHLPHELLVPVFLGVMADTMTTLLTQQRFCATTLADYIQYFVIGHPFERINFSVCMAQVNAILWSRGYEPIYHGWFDFECFVYDYDRIEQILVSKLKRRMTCG